MPAWPHRPAGRRLHLTARPILLVSGLSGAGKSSVLRILEDLGYDAVDNAPLAMIDEIVRRGKGAMAIGVDARTDGFDAALVLETLGRLRCDPALRAELLFAVAEETVLLRRYTATRRMHPLARGGASVLDGIAAETRLTAGLRAQADLVIDTSELRPPELRGLVEARYSFVNGDTSKLTISLVSFAFPAGLPRESDMVFDARFLRNPFYDTILSPMTGIERAVVAHIEDDPGYAPFLDKVHELLRLVLPRFVTEGKKYATIAVGCSGGRHRSVAVIEALARRLGQTSGVDVGCNGFQIEGKRLHYVRYPILVMHRELLRMGQPS